MCTSKFAKILVGEDRMVLCRFSCLKKAGARFLVLNAFPELFKEWGFWARLLRRIDVKVECCFKMYSSQFDVQVGPLEKENDWDEIPFVALRVFPDGGLTRCSATPVEFSDKHLLLRGY